MSTTDATATTAATTQSTLAEAGHFRSQMVSGRLGDGADDPITGPMPAVDLLEGKVRAHVHKRVTIVSLDGGLDDELAEQVVPIMPGATTGAAAIILDVDQVTLLDRTAFELLATALDHAAGERDRCIVASRLSGRLVLEKWGFTHRYAVFTSVADALQARAFAMNGYGEGWLPVS